MGVRSLNEWFMSEVLPLEHMLTGFLQRTHIGKETKQRLGSAWGAATCTPGGNAVVVQSQRENNDAMFSHARWALWQIGLDGTERAQGMLAPRP